MGNVGIHPKSPPINDFMSSIPTSTNSSATRFKSAIFMYKFFVEDQMFVQCQPVNFNEFEAFDDQLCYLIVNVYSIRGDNLTEASPLKSDDTKPSLKSIFTSTQSNLTPRGQKNATAAEDSRNSVKVRKSGFFDIYIWNGINAPEIVKAFAVAKSFLLESSLKNASRQEKVALTSCSELCPVTKIFKDDITNSKRRKEQSVIANNQLFARIIVNACSCDLLRKIFSTSTLQAFDSQKLLQTLNKTSLLPEKRTKRRKSKQEDRKLPKNLAHCRSTSLPAKTLLSIAKLPLKKDSAMPSIKPPDRNTVEYPSELEDKKLKLKRFDPIISEIIPSTLYLGSQTVAKNLKLLQETGITHILNCAGVYCGEYFPQDFTYKTYHLYDGNQEPIDNVFYDALEWMHDVIENKKGKLYIHCQQGVSRSSTMVILYIMWKNKQNFIDVAEHVKKLRGIASPNIGFIAKLTTWHKRREAKPITEPRLYRIFPHNKRSPDTVAMSYESTPKQSKLDSRGAFIIETSNKLYIWKGKDCDAFIYNGAKKSAAQLQKFDEAPSKVIVMKQGKEKPEFLALFSVDKLTNVDANSHYDKLYYPTCLPRGPCLYFYPDWKLQTNFTTKDLNSNKAIVLRYNMRIFLWIGSDFTGDDDPDEIGFKFVDDNQDVVPKGSPVFIVHQGKETDFFWKYFKLDSEGIAKEKSEIE